MLLYLSMLVDRIILSVSLGLRVSMIGVNGFIVLLSRFLACCV